MAGVTIEELGLRFVQICMENYWSGCLLPVFFLAGILWDIFYRRRKESRVFLYYLVFLALTVYNPVLVKYVIPKVHFESEYYRFIWILPVIPGAAYYAVRIVEAVRLAEGCNSADPCGSDRHYGDTCSRHCKRLCDGGKHL